jgi:aryl carrier-like protein
MTAERFVPNPFSSEPGTRLYRTGDLAKYLTDGNIEFVGRVDHQVKLRGFRIELGEIEAVLEQRSDVREAVVIVREDAPGVKRLVAYVVGADDGPAPDAAELRDALASRLPPYMVPSAFVALERFPLSTNHKVDVKALPAPVVDRAETASLFIAPTSELEHAIAQICCELLGVERIGVRDNFFDLGGNSLLLVRLQTRLKELLGRDVTVVALFQHPSVAALANHLGNAQSGAAHIDHARERATTRLERRAQRRETRSSQARPTPQRTTGESEFPTR